MLLNVLAIVICPTYISNCESLSLNVRILLFNKAKRDGGTAVQSTGGVVHNVVAGIPKDEKDDGKCKRQKVCANATIQEPTGEATLQFVENILGITPPQV